MERRLTSTGSVANGQALKEGQVMKVFLSLATATALVFGTAIGGSTEADAFGYSKYRKGGYYGYPPYRKRPQVRGYVRRGGGYSYEPEDTINTYGDSRTFYGSTNVFRDHWADRQTPSGPFDHGFFFDSGIQPNGGNSPYMN